MAVPPIFSQLQYFVAASGASGGCIFVVAPIISRIHIECIVGCLSQFDSILLTDTSLSRRVGWLANTVTVKRSRNLRKLQKLMAANSTWRRRSWRRCTPTSRRTKWHTAWRRSSAAGIWPGTQPLWASVGRSAKKLNPILPFSLFSLFVATQNGSQPICRQGNNLKSIKLPQKQKQWCVYFQVCCCRFLLHARSIQHAHGRQSIPEFSATKHCGNTRLCSGPILGWVLVRNLKFKYYLKYMLLSSSRRHLWPSFYEFVLFPHLILRLHTVNHVGRR